MKKLVLIAALFALSACAQGRDSRYVGNVFDPLCAPDGSVVLVQNANSKGKFLEMRASRENCPWYKAPESKD